VRAALPDYANGGDLPLLFLHERTTPGGVHYVVAAHLQTSHQFVPVRQGGSGAGRVVSMKLDTRRQLAVEARLATSLGPPPSGAMPFQQRAVELILPDSESREIVRFDGDIPVGQSPNINYGNALRFFAGQVDPDDAGHFTLGYQVDGRDGVIDVRVKDDGIDIRPREGAWAVESTRQGWRLPAGPLKGPTSTPSSAPSTRPETMPTPVP
jgi:hypothetical protein